MTDEEVLERAVKDAPEDGLAKLALADYLEGEGRSCWEKVAWLRLAGGLVFVEEIRVEVPPNAGTVWVGQEAWFQVRLSTHTGGVRFDWAEKEGGWCWSCHNVSTAWGHDVSGVDNLRPTVEAAAQLALRGRALLMGWRLVRLCRRVVGWQWYWQYGYWRERQFWRKGPRRFIAEEERGPFLTQEAAGDVT